MKGTGEIGRDRRPVASDNRIEEGRSSEAAVGNPAAEVP